MKQPFGVKPVRSCLRLMPWIDANHKKEHGDSVQWIAVEAIKPSARNMLLMVSMSSRVTPVAKAGWEVHQRGPLAYQRVRLTIVGGEMGGIERAVLKLHAQQLPWRV